MVVVAAGRGEEPCAVGGGRVAVVVVTDRPYYFSLIECASFTVVVIGSELEAALSFYIFKSSIHIMLIDNVNFHAFFLIFLCLCVCVIMVGERERERERERESKKKKKRKRETNL